jgi:hypothetical protein
MSNTDSPYHTHPPPPQVQTWREVLEWCRVPGTGTYLPSLAGDNT